MASSASASSSSPPPQQDTSHPQPLPFKPRRPGGPVGERLRKSSVVGERVALQNLEHMQQLTQHVLQQSSFRTSQVGPAAIHRAFVYWLSEPVRRLCQKKKRQQFPDSGLLPLEQAHRLVDWLFHQFDHVAQNEAEKHKMAAAIEHVLTGSNHGSSVNQGLSRLMVLYLQPLQGTRAAIEDQGHRHAHTQAVDYMYGLQHASRCLALLERVHADPHYFPRLQPDQQSSQSVMNLIGKRCKFLTYLGPRPHDTRGKFSPRIRRGVRWTDPATVAALGGCETARDCIEAGKAFLTTMKERPHPSDHPQVVHYSTLLSMFSYASKQEGGFADEAFSFLKQLEEDPHFECNSVALYNPVLLAYLNEAAMYWYKPDAVEQSMEAKAKAEALFEHIKSLPDPAISSDPITYSIMMTLYKDLDQAETAQRLLDEMEQYAATRVTRRRTTGPSENYNHEKMPAPTLMHYNAVLNAWSKSSDPQAGDRAAALLRRMEQHSSGGGGGGEQSRVVPGHSAPRQDLVHLRPDGRLSRIRGRRHAGAHRNAAGAL